MSVTRWKLAGVTVGIVSVVGGSATAYAWTGHSPSASAPNVASVSASNVSASTAAAKNARLKIAAADAVGWITAITSRLEDKVAEIGSPATITPDQAEHLRVKIRFVSFLQGKAGDLAAAGTAGAAALQARLGALKDKLSSILTNATVVKPFVGTSVKSTSDADADADLGAFDPDRRHCDGDHTWSSWGDPSSRSFGDHHDWYGAHDYHHDGFHH